MTWPTLLRCTSSMDGERCDLHRFHPATRHEARRGRSTRSWSTESTKRETYETTAPWVTWTWLSSDRETRITGRMRHKLTCCVCGKREIVRTPIPRWGPITPPPGGVHPSRLAAVERHAHPDRGHPMSWAIPLRNPGAHRGGLDLDLMAMRLQADVDEHYTADNPPPWINRRKRD